MSTARPLAALLALGIGLAACSGAASSADADLRVAVGHLPASTEQLHLDRYAGSVLFHNASEMLVEYDDREQRLRPMVATRSAELDDLTIELTIRDDIRFHDGTELTAKLLARLLVRMNEELGDAMLLTDIEVVDDTRVRLHTAEPQLGLVDLLTSAPTALWLPASEDGVARLGTRPHEVAGFAAGQADVAPRIGSAGAETVAATDGCGTRRFPMTSPSAPLTDEIFWDLDMMDLPAPFGTDDVADSPSFGGVDGDRLHEEAGLELLVIADDLDREASTVWRVDLRQP